MGATLRDTDVVLKFSHRPQQSTASIRLEDCDPPRTVRAVAFDTGDILYDSTAWWRWLVQLLSRMGIHTHFGPLYLVWRREYLCDVNSGIRDYWDALTDFLLAIGLSSGQVDEVLVAIRPKLQTTRNLRCIPGVPKTLTRMTAGGVTLGIVSNAPCPAERIWSNLELLGLDSHFGVVSASVEAGAPVDEPERYRIAARDFGVSPDEIVFIGHASEELSGASAAGMITVGINHDHDARADVLLEQFEQILDVIRIPSVTRQAC